MTRKSTCFWLCAALGLFAFIFFVRPHAPKPPAGPPRVLPGLNPGAVTSIQVRPNVPMALEITASRTNHAWNITEPLAYPARADSINQLLVALSNLTAATVLSPAEMRNRPNADSEFGFDAPQASLLLRQGDSPVRVLFGARTAPGDQVFLQVVGREEAYVVDADLLKLLPRSANDWRDTTVLDLEKLAFDHIAVTNNGKWFLLEREAATDPWRMSAPMAARADSDKINVALANLQSLRVEQFISDEPRTDAEPLGLAPAELEIAFLQGTGTVASVQFGRSPTNDPGSVYARLAGHNTIFTVASNLLASWRRPINDYRDPRVVTFSAPIETIEGRGQESFSLHQTNGAWHIEPEDLTADPGLVGDLVSTLTNLQIVQLARDAVTPPDLPEYGLAPPVLEYSVRTAASPSTPAGKNPVCILRFGFATNQTDKLFVLRADESSIYAVATNEFPKLPVAGWQLRDRSFWRFSADDIVGVTIHQQGRERRIRRKGPGEWTLAPGSQGLIMPLAVEATVGGFAKPIVDRWVAVGDEHCANYGFKPNGHQVTLDLKDGASATVEFGGTAPSTDQYAAVRLDGKLWIFEFPWRLYRDVQLYLSAP